MIDRALKIVVVIASLALGPSPVLHGQSSGTDKPRAFRVWVSSDAHIGRDLRNGRESLADAIRDSEQDGNTDEGGFDWDIALMLGDFSGNTQPPDDAEGAEVVKQF